MISFEQNMKVAQSILDQAADAAKRVETWTKMSDPPGCTSYMGSVTGKDIWIFVLVKLPEGHAKGYDGTATKNSIIVRTPQDAAEVLYKIAEEKCNKQ